MVLADTGMPWRLITYFSSSEKGLKDCRDLSEREGVSFSGVHLLLRFLEDGQLKKSSHPKLDGPEPTEMGRGQVGQSWMGRAGWAEVEWD